MAPAMEAVAEEKDEKDAGAAAGEPEPEAERPPSGAPAGLADPDGLADLPMGQVRPQAGAAAAACIEAAAARRGLPHMRMTSGAGHDAQMMARIAPSAMVFVPSRGGVSHNPREHTDDDQLALGAQVKGSLALQLVTNTYFNGQCIRLDGAIRLAPR